MSRGLPEELGWQQTPRESSATELKENDHGILSMLLAKWQREKTVLKCCLVS